METLRCPTCLSILRDGQLTRCPSCRARLKGRKSLVLREDTRITSRPPLAIERDRKARVEAEIAAAEQRRYTPTTMARLETPHAPRIFESEPPAVSPPPPPPPPPPRAKRRERRHDAPPPRPTTPAPPRRDEPEVSDAPAHSLFDLLADYTIDGAPERTLPPEAAPVDVPAPVDDVASAPSEQVTGKTRSRLLRRRPLTAKRRMDDALASVRVEVKAEALKRMLEADAEAPGDAEVPVQPEVAVVVEPGVVEDEVVAADVDEPEDTVVDPPEVALEARAAVEVAEPPENAASASTEAEPVAELPVRSRWAWRRKDFAEFEVDDSAGLDSLEDAFFEPVVAAEALVEVEPEPTPEPVAFVEPEPCVEEPVEVAAVEEPVEVAAVEEPVEVAAVEEPVEVVVEVTDEPVVVEPTATSEAIAESEPIVDFVAPPAPKTNGTRRGFRLPWLARHAPEPVVEAETFAESVNSVETASPATEDVIVDDPSITDPVAETVEAVEDRAVTEPQPEVTAEVEPEDQPDELATRVDASVDALLALIPEVVDEPAEPEADDVPPVDEVVEVAAPAEVAASPEVAEDADEPERVAEEPIARVDAAVQALMSLLPGSVEVEPDEHPVEPEVGVEAPAPLEVATDEVEVDDPVDAPAARVDASVDELMALLTPRDEPVDDSPPVEERPAALADAELDEVAEARHKPRRRRGARRRADLAAAIDAAARALGDSEPSTVEAASEPEPEVAVEEPVAVAVEPEPEVAVEEPVAVVVEPEPEVALAKPAPSRSRLLRGGRRKRPVVAEEPRTTLFDVEPVAGPEVEEPAAQTEPDGPELVAPTLDLVYETAAEPERDVEPAKSRSRRKRRAAKRAERKDVEDDAIVPVSLFESPAPVVAPEAFIDLTAPEPEVVAPIEETPAASIAEPDIDLTAQPVADPIAPPTRGRSRGWRVRRTGRDEPSVEVPAAAAREVIVPEVVVPEVVVPEVVVPEVVVPEVVVPEVVVPEVVGEPVAEMHNGYGNGNGNGVEVVEDDLPFATPVEVVDAPTPVAPPTVDLPAQTRAVRVKTVKVNGKRRWVVDVLVRQEEQQPKRRQL